MCDRGKKSLARRLGPLSSDGSNHPVTHELSCEEMYKLFQHAVGHHEMVSTERLVHFGCSRRHSTLAEWKVVWQLFCLWGEGGEVSDHSGAYSTHSCSSSTGGRCWKSSNGSTVSKWSGEAGAGGRGRDGSLIYRILLLVGIHAMYPSMCTDSRIACT